MLHDFYEPFDDPECRTHSLQCCPGQKNLAFAHCVVQKKSCNSNASSGQDNLSGISFYEPKSCDIVVTGFSLHNHHSGRFRFSCLSKLEVENRLKGNLNSQVHFLAIKE